MRRPVTDLRLTVFARRPPLVVSDSDVEAFERARDEIIRFWSYGTLINLPQIMSDISGLPRRKCARMIRDRM